MKTRAWLVVLIVILASGLFIFRGSPEGESARVIRIVDGDTIDVELENGLKESVRFLGIDAPEINWDANTADCYAWEAREALDIFVKDKKVRLVADKDQPDRDQYGRLLRYIFVGEKNINAELIKAGASHELSVGEYGHQTSFKALELDAQKQKIGLWAACQS